MPEDEVQLPESDNTLPQEPTPTPAPPSLPASPQLGSRNIRTTEIDGKAVFYGRDGKPLEIPESRQEEYKKLNESITAMEEDDASYYLSKPEETQNANTEDTSQDEAVEEPADTPAASKRDKDTLKAYHEGQQKIKQLSDKLENYKDYDDIKTANQQALTALEIIYSAAQRNPDLFQQLLGVASTNHVPSQEEMEEDPAKYQQNIRNIIREEAAKTLYSDPDVVRLKVGYDNLKEVNGFITKHFEGNNKHPDLVAAQPYLEATLAQHQQRGEKITLEKAWDEYQRAREYFASTGKVGAAGKNGKTIPSKNVAPESSPQAKPQAPLPGKYAGVGGRTVDPRAGMQSMTRKQKIEEFGRQILAGQAGSRFSR